MLRNAKQPSMENSNLELYVGRTALYKASSLNRLVDQLVRIGAHWLGYYYRHELKGMHYGEFCNYVDYFASRLLSGGPNSPDLTEGVRTLSTMAAIVEALRTGRPARVQPT